MDAMPLDTATARNTDNYVGQRPDRVEASARALADTLDSLLGYDDERLSDALLEIGELLGGLGVNGFKADLQAHLDRLEEDLIADASPQDYSPGWGGNDPNQVFSAELQDRIAEMRAADAQDWAQEADQILQRALLGEAA